MTVAAAAKGSRNSPGVLAVEVAAGQARARRCQPGPERLVFFKDGPQCHPGHARKKVQAECREDVVAVNAQRVGRPGRRQKRQRRKQRQRQHTALLGLFSAPQRRKCKRCQQRRAAPERRARDQIRQVQCVQQGQPHREEHGLGQRQVVIRAQPLPRRDILRRAEHQFIVQRGAAHPGVRLLKARQRQAQADQQGADQPEAPAGQAKLLFV